MLRCPSGGDFSFAVRKSVDSAFYEFIKNGKGKANPQIVMMDSFHIRLLPPPPPAR